MNFPSETDPKWNGPWLYPQELTHFKSIGKNVKISRQAIIFGSENISIGDNVRIDAQNLILASKGYLEIGSYVHLAAGSKYICTGGIEIRDFSQVAFNCVLLSASDDFSGDYLIGPTIPNDYLNVTEKKIVLGICSVLGVGCILSPGTYLDYGAAMGANSLTIKNQLLFQNSIYIGSPAKFLKLRSSIHFEMADKILAQDIHKP